MNTPRFRIWGGGKRLTGAAIKTLSEGGLDKFYKELIKVQNYNNSIAKEIAEALDAIQGFTTHPNPVG